MKSIRKTRGVPAKRGMRVLYRYENRRGRITSAKHGYLMIRLDGDKLPLPLHPTWELNYYDEAGNLLYQSRSSQGERNGK